MHRPIKPKSKGFIRGHKDYVNGKNPLVYLDIRGNYIFTIDDDMGLDQNERDEWAVDYVDGYTTAECQGY